jgi:beta-lactamase class D
MPRTLIAALFVLLLVPTSASAGVQDRPDLLRHFEAAGTAGTMVIERHGAGRSQTILVGHRRARNRYLPSSTFKIPNSLLAIERGVASGPEQAYPGPNPNFLVDGAPLLPVACEGDLTLATAFTNSCIPIYQGIARRLGPAAYERGLRALHYGNGRLDGAPVDAFWLQGPFAISATEQVAFLERLRRGTLRLKRRTLDAVRGMLVTEQSGATVLRGKTGYVFSTAPRLGWWVGWVQSAGRTWSFALNLDVTRPEHLAARTTIGRAILRDLGAPV